MCGWGRGHGPPGGCRRSAFLLAATLAYASSAGHEPKGELLALRPGRPRHKVRSSLEWGGMSTKKSTQ
jgi:hypothetical protein